VISLSEQTPNSYILNVATKDGSFQTPNLMASNISGITGANLQAPGSTTSIDIGNMKYIVSYQNGNSVKLELAAVSGSVTADVMKSSQFGNNGVDGTVLDNTVFTTTPTLIDTYVLDSSNEFHTTRIRQQDPATGLWSIYDVSLFPSANAARTNIWYKLIASGLSY
jgi:hypothetical protein